MVEHSDLLVCNNGLTVMHVSDWLNPHYKKRTGYRRELISGSLEEIFGGNMAGLKSEHDVEKRARMVINYLSQEKRIVLLSHTSQEYAKKLAHGYPGKVWRLKAEVRDDLFCQRYPEFGEQREQILEDLHLVFSGQEPKHGLVEVVK